MRRASGVVLASITWIWMITVASAEDPESYYRYYYKQKVPMIADTQSIAIHDAALGSREDLTQFLGDAGYPASELRDYLLRGWTIAFIRSASGTPPISNVAPVISRLAELSRSSRYFFSPIFTNDSGDPLLITPKILVRFAPGITAQRARELLASVGMQEAQPMPFGGMENSFRVYAGSVSGIRVLEMANHLAELSEVIYAEPNMVMTGHTASIPSDPLFVDSWGLHNTGQFPGAVADIDIDAPEAWQVTSGDPSIIVVVIDVGVQHDHPDINQILGSDHTGIHSSPEGDGRPGHECDIHGTAVAGVVSAIANNSIGTTGVAPNVKIASARAGVSGLSCSGQIVIESQWVVDALAWAESTGANVTNNSFYLDPAFISASLSSKFQDTYNNGIVHFAGAGNEPTEPVAYPANLSSVNAVSSISWEGQLSPFSSFGPEIMFAAPGSQIRTTDRTGPIGWDPGDYVIADGTSFASPMAAGVAALILSVSPELPPANVEEIMRATAMDLGESGRDDLFGWGLVNAGNSISFLVIFGDGFETGDTSRWSAAVP